jgi:hypothetical protein
MLFIGVSLHGLAAKSNSKGDAEPLPGAPSAKN